MCHGQKTCRHMAAYGHAMWRCVGVRAYVCACECARLLACDERDKASFLGYPYLSLMHMHYIHVNSL